MMDSYFFVRFQLKDGTKLPMLGPYVDLQSALKIIEEHGEMLLRTYIAGPNNLFIPNSLKIRCLATVEEYIATQESGWVYVGNKVTEEF